MSAKNTNQPMADTYISIENRDWQIKIWLGLGGLAVLVVLAFVYRFEAGIIALAIGGAYAGRVALAGYHRHKLAQFERRRLEAETAKLEYEALQARARTHFVEVNSGTFVLEGIAVAAFYPAVSASKLLADVPQLPAPESAPKLRRLLDVEFIHLLVVGPSGSGKTTALCHLIDAAPADALICVLDPHAQFNRWPARAREIVGTGRDYPAIDAKLYDLIQRMDRRYNGLESTGQKVLIIADEWLSIRDKCPNAERFFTDIGSEARKVNMNLVISSISSTVDDLAVSGAIRDNLAQLTLSRTLKSLNQGELKWSRKDTELVELPGPYYARPAPPLVSAASWAAEFGTSNPEPAEELPVTFEGEHVSMFHPTQDELRIYELHLKGESLRSIFQKVYPDRSFGGNQANELKAILAKFGVTV